ncbi:MAG: carboxypeptidase-like regulatory domain-containing protein, partial [Cyclobacteriaceae bacterium]|nr:carboxypeptidase-like regulatory domain-containing protein [Cyclobacteriaceae bacterium]
MKYCYLLFLLLSLGSTRLSAQKGRIEGMVVDKESFESIPFASIAIIDTNKGSAVTGTVSDNTGKFAIEDLSWGRYQVLISFIGYETDSSRIIEVSDG